MIRGKKLYDSSPIWLQTLAANFASSRNFRQKYGQVFHESSNRLEQNEKKSQDELQRDQLQAIQRVLGYAVQHVPYYRERRFSPDNFHDWPILEKQTIAATPEKFLSDEFSPGDLRNTPSKRPDR